MSDGAVIRKLLNHIDHKPLSREEEAKLLKRAKRGVKAARTRLVEANQRFVARVALAHKNNGVPLEDLIQEGNLGLIEAIDRFDLSKNCRLVSYAAWWIRLYIQRAIEQKSRTVNIPINKIAALKKIRDFEYGFLKQYGRAPGCAEIAAHTGFSEEKVAKIRRAGTTTLSIHCEDEEGQSMEDRLEVNPADELQGRILHDQMHRHLLDALEELSERERDVIRSRFGLGGDGEPLSLRQAGKRLGLSPEGVRQIQAQAFKKLVDPEQCARLHQAGAMM